MEVGLGHHGDQPPRGETSSERERDSPKATQGVSSGTWTLIFGAATPLFLLVKMWVSEPERPGF